MIDINKTSKHQWVIATIGSTKNKTYRKVTGVIVDYVARSITATHCVIEAVIATPAGEIVQTSRVAAV